jgi:hypothetical protein
MIHRICDGRKDDCRGKFPGTPEMKDGKRIALRSGPDSNRLMGRRYFGPVAFSVSRTATVVFMTASGLSERLSIPCSTRNRANSG